MVKNPPANAGDLGLIPGSEKDPLEKEMVTHSSILAWKILWTEKPGGLQSMGLQNTAHLMGQLGPDSVPGTSQMLSACVECVATYSDDPLSH